MKLNVFVIVLISFLVVGISGCINNNSLNDTEAKSYAVNMTMNHGVNKTIEDIIIEKGNADKKDIMFMQTVDCSWEAYKIDNDNYKVICEYGVNTLNQEEPTQYTHKAEFQTNIKTGDLIGLNDLGKQIISEADRTN